MSDNDKRPTVALPPIHVTGQNGMFRNAVARVGASGIIDLFLTPAAQARDVPHLSISGTDAERRGCLTSLLLLSGAKQNTTDADAMLQIQELMDGQEWSPETLDDIAAIVRKAGYRIRDLDDNDPGTPSDEETRRRQRRAERKKEPRP